MFFYIVFPQREYFFHPSSKYIGSVMNLFLCFINMPEDIHYKASHLCTKKEKSPKLESVFITEAEGSETVFLYVFYTVLYPFLRMNSSIYSYIFFLMLAPR